MMRPRAPRGQHLPPVPFLILILISSAAGVAAATVARRYPHTAPGSTTTSVVDAVAGASDRTTRLGRWIGARRDPQIETGLALSIALGVVIAGGALLGLLAYLVRTNDALREIDATAAQWGHDNATRFSDAAVELVTQMGGTWVVAVAGLVLVIADWLRRPNRFVAPFLLTVVLGDKLVTHAVKALADRARPTLNPIAETLGPSFPSGHSSTAAAFFAGAALVLGRGRSSRVRTVLAGIAVGIAVAVACSRVLLDVHWLTDVVAGLALGWAWFALCAIAFGGRLLRFGITAERIETAARARPGRRPRS